MISMASPMLQEVFAGSLIGRPDISFTHLNDEQRRMVATIGTLVLTVFGHLDFSLRVGTTGSHVPYKSLFRLRRRLYAGCRSGSLQDDSPTDPGSEGRRFGAGSQVQASNHCLENASPNHPGLEGDTYPIDGIGGLHVQKSPDGISDRAGNTRLGGDLFHPGRSAPAKRSRLCSYGTGDLWWPVRSRHARERTAGWDRPRVH